MSWTTLTPYLPLLRLAVGLLVLVQLGRTAVGIRRAAMTAPPLEALRACRGGVALTLALALFWVWLMLGASSAFRPKDAIEADYRERGRRLGEIDRREPVAGLPEAAPGATDWEAARSRFREFTREQERQFEKAVSE